MGKQTGPAAPGGRSRAGGQAAEPGRPGGGSAASPGIGLWGQRRVQAELARLGFTVSARTVARYMRRSYHGVPSPTWRQFLRGHAKEIWACDFFSVRTIVFQTLYVFFVMHHETRRILQVRVSQHPTAAWATQQVVDACGWERDPHRGI